MYKPSRGADSGHVRENNNRHTRLGDRRLTRRAQQAGGTDIVRAGHPALDAALSAEAVRADALSISDNPLGAPASLTHPCDSTPESPAPHAGHSTRAMSVTADRDGIGVTTIHVMVTIRATGPDLRTRELRVWRALAEQSWN